MCKGREKLIMSSNNSHNHDEESSSEIMGFVSCELCSSEACLYCQADDAFLCRKCDKWVHSANFLAQRHIRCILCKTCRSLTQRYLVATSFEVVLPTVVSLPQRRRREMNMITNNHSSSSSSSTNSIDTNSRSFKEPFLFL